MSVRLGNGSRIVGLPGSEGTVRGFSAVSLLLIDEASRVPDAMCLALRPMRAVQGETWFRQEYLCEFVDNGTEVFGRDLVEAAVDAEMVWWPLGERTAGLWQTPLARGRVCIGVDVGKRQDFTAIAVVERRPGGSEVAVRHLERLPLGTGFVEAGARVRELAADGRLGSNRHVVVDATGLGGPFVDIVRPGLACGMTAVTLTGGEAAGGWRVVVFAEGSVVDAGAGDAGGRGVADSGGVGGGEAVGAGAVLHAAAGGGGVGSMMMWPWRWRWGVGGCGGGRRGLWGSG